MSRVAARRFWTSSTHSSIVECPSPFRPILQCTRSQPFSSTALRIAPEDAQPLQQPSAPARSPRPSQQSLGGSSESLKPPASNREDVGGLLDLANMFDKNQASRAVRNRERFDMDISRLSSIGNLPERQDDRYEEPHHFHVYATKHNTHITLTNPKRDPLVSVSTGNLGFKKAGRKHYDSAFQLAGYALKKIQEAGLIPQIKKMEVTLRGFGPGREAATKVLLGTEGKLFRNKVVKVSDATRLKFGGTRSPRPRRLG
ncbi:MAG: hypothetical protein M1818_005844 [Claussenomyces sp. TS43310]|nr:MAG: hypothetical protein M1818_005844 [Claussenomyces sp. TS43310]